MERFEQRKTVQALNYLATLEGGKINKMKALKLLWLSDKLHLIKYGRLISGDNYFALKNGPVASKGKDSVDLNSDFLTIDEFQYAFQYFESEGYDFSSKKSPELKVFSKTDIESMDLVYKEYGKLKEFELSELSHEFAEWKQHESDILRGVKRINIRTEDLFFDAPKSQIIFNIDSDLKQITKEIYETDVFISRPRK